MEMEMGAGEDKRFDSKRNQLLDLWQLFATSANGFAIFAGDVQELEAIVAVVEVAEFRKHSHRRLASWHDELQPHAFFRDQWLTQRRTNAAESHIDGGAGEFHLLEPAEVLNANFDRQREAGKRAEILAAVLSEGRHESLVYHRGKVLARSLCAKNR